MTKSLSRQLTWNNMELSVDDHNGEEAEHNDDLPNGFIKDPPGILIKEPSHPGILTKSDSYARFLATNQGRRRSTLLTHTYTNVKVSYWATDPYAKDYALRLFTCFYAIFIVIVGVVLELSNLIAYGTEQVAHLKDLFFSTYMYGCSIAVIGFCARNVLVDHKNLKRIRRNMAKMDIYQEEPEMLTNTSTGSMYLRIGCVVFGLIGVVYYVLMSLVCTFGWEGITANECNASGIAISLMAAVFVFFQMWFVYCNGKIAINGKSRYIISFGLMHLVATNLWLWIRYILYEEVQTLKEIRLAKFHDNSTSSDILQEFLSIDWGSTGTTDHHHDHHNTTDLIHAVTSGHECQGIQCLFGDFSEFMYTCVVEYSLICAGVAFVFWTNCGVHGEGEKIEEPRQKLRKRNIVTIDCSRTAEGLFAGFVFLICTILAVSLFNAYSTSAHMAQIIFLSTNIFFYAVAIVVCCYAFWRMKVLAFNHEPAEEDESAEFLDEILLVVGLLGELVFCLGGLLAFINNQDIHVLSILLFVSNFLRLIQVAIQSGLIMIGSRLVLDIENPKTIRYKPGKQVITLLLIINLALFFMNIFEAQKAGVTDEIVQMYGGRSWALIVRGCSPLTVFFRFHSSVCFAEIWKKTFKVQRARTRSV
ncbi:hypothetical protein PFISCL1PPCAC_27316 [Pristionchus fissidentatus]|uniref:Otpl-3 n=1 Tax=Pristionchus fissidentatus TaxID=1538716 RepID=A0AAV5WV01_9BILA|nr:hypothetical protein PFISCL1PPCAC_27316 [Pristionchus fissidentatus]